MESSLLKIARAADGDDLFRMRVQIACELAGVEYSRTVLLAVAQEVVDGITVDEAGTVTTTGVTDEAIESAVGSSQPQSAPAESEVTA